MLLFDNFSDLAEEFGKWLTSELTKIIMNSKYTHKGCAAVNKHSLWSDYHSFISSSEFLVRWTDFLHGTLFEEPCAILFQSVTQKILDKFIKEQFPLPNNQPLSIDAVNELSYIEENALRYVSGYIIFSAIKKVKRSNFSNKEDLLFVLEEMHDESEGSMDYSSDWTKLINRGGLIQVKANTYRFFYSIEIELRKFMSINNEALLDEGFKLRAYNLISENVDVLYNWKVCNPDNEGLNTEYLLQTIIETYITVRGFSFASSIMELYKQQKKKATQKSVGLRKKLAK